MTPPVGNEFTLSLTVGPDAITYEQSTFALPIYHLKAFPPTQPIYDSADQDAPAMKLPATFCRGVQLHMG